MQKILVGLDGSPRQDDVLRAAVALACANDAALILTRCVGIPAEVPIEALSVAPSEVPRLLEAQALHDLESLQARLHGAVSSRVRAVVGTPWQGIEQVAHEEDVDLVVIGAHGYGGLDRILGTTAAKVVNHADRAVLVVRSVDRLLRSSPMPTDQSTREPSSTRVA